MTARPALWFGLIVSSLLATGCTSPTTARTPAPTALASATAAPPSPTIAAASPSQSVAARLYRSSAFHFEFQVPPGFTTATGGDPSGISIDVTMDPAAFTGTNLRQVTARVAATLEPARVQGCLAPLVNSQVQSERNVEVNGMVFLVQTTVQSAAGSTFKTTIYRTVQKSGCYYIGLTVGSTQIANYAPGTVREFDGAKIDALLMSIVESFRVT